MIHSFQALLTGVLVIFIGSVAIFFGTVRERIGGCMLLISTIIGIIFMYFLPRFAFWPLLATDITSLLVYTALCWKSPNPWPIWAAGFQCINLMCQAQGAAPSVSRWVYYSALIISGYGVLAALFIGTVTTALHRRRQKRQDIG